MKIGIRVMPRAEILDTQGRAVEALLQQSGEKVENCQIGRYVLLDINEQDADRAIHAAKRMAEFVLYNPLIETFEIEQIEGKAK